MALSNAERQARHKQRLRAAAKGVTPDMVVEAVRILHEHTANDDPTVGTWAATVANIRERRNRGTWAGFVPDDIGPDAYDFLEGEDRVLVERVASVAHAIRNPPLVPIAEPLVTAVEPIPAQASLR